MLDIFRQNNDFIKRPMTPYMQGDTSKQIVPLNNPKDKVYTPNDTAKFIIDKLDSLYGIYGTILDPCKGPGAFYNNYPDKCKKDYCEIDEGKNFFDYKDKVDWIISNPPYSIFNEFHSHALNIADNIVWLIPINKLTSSGRRIAELSKWGGIRLIIITTNVETEFSFGFATGAVYFKKGYNENHIDIEYSDNFKLTYGLGK